MTLRSTSKSCVILYWQRYYTTLEQRASAKICGMLQGMELQNFRRGRHLYSTGRLSRWALPHSLVFFCFYVWFPAVATVSFRVHVKLLIISYRIVSYRNRKTQWKTKWKRETTKMRRRRSLNAERPLNHFLLRYVQYYRTYLLVVDQ